MAIPTNEWNEFRKENRDAHKDITELLRNHDNRITEVETKQGIIMKVFGVITGFIISIITVCFGFWIKGK